MYSLTRLVWRSYVQLMLTIPRQPLMLGGHIKQMITKIQSEAVQTLEIQLNTCFSSLYSDAAELFKMSDIMRGQWEEGHGKKAFLFGYSHGLK